MTSKLEMIYKKLRAYFGAQHWWPAQTSFEVMVGAILTQNTNWTNVEKAISNLKKNRLLGPDKLYHISQKKLSKYIVPAGYYNIKAKRLKGFLGFFFKYYQGRSDKMAAQDKSELRRQLLSVNGIGPETADSILLYALDKPIFVVDSYTKRILSRHRLILDSATYEEVQSLFMRNLPCSAKLFNEYHALLVRLGKEFCLKRSPRCQFCPLESSGARSPYV